VRKECEALNIEFHILYGSGADVMPDFIKKHKLGALVVDFMPVRKHQGWVEQLRKTLPSDIPLCQVIDSSCILVGLLRSYKSHVRYIGTSVFTVRPVIVP